MVVKHKAGEIKGKDSIYLSFSPSGFGLWYTFLSICTRDQRISLFPQPVSQPPTTADAVCCVKLSFKLCVQGSNFQILMDKDLCKNWTHPAFFPAVAVPFLPLSTCTNAHIEGGLKSKLLRMHPPVPSLGGGLPRLASSRHTSACFSPKVL